MKKKRYRRCCKCIFAFSVSITDILEWCLFFVWGEFFVSSGAYIHIHKSECRPYAPTATGPPKCVRGKDDNDGRKTSPNDDVQQICLKGRLDVQMKMFS